MPKFGSSEQESAFNPALKYVNSIAGLLDLLDFHSLQGRYKLVYKTLYRIYLRVEHKFKKEESKEIQNLFDTAPKLLNLKSLRRITREYNFQKKLDEIDKKLKRYMNRYGLLMPSKEDPRFAVLKR